MVEGNGFANTVSAFDRFLPGPWVSAESLEPFTLTLRQFQATYIAQGGRRGQPVDFEGAMTVSDVPGRPDRRVTLKVNEPVEVNGTQTYLLGNGYAPVFRVTDGTGQVAFDGPVPCLVEQVSTLASGCVVKVPDARPTQLVFAAAATLGVTLAVSVRRRRVWWRGEEVAGLARTNRAAFAAEFDGLVKELGATKTQAFSISWATSPERGVPVYEIVAALAPPVVVGGAFIAGVVHLVRAEGRAKAAEGRAARERAAAPPDPGRQPEPRADG
ncbi:cytochrome c biogenesis protein ResB [Nonomuraea sp. NPDC005701]|uniref:cytochrome c biogenesis protein ResB n=1 Tax=Nonomuraea sp. NPDC005701 TaxID=3157049 RepID=UPI0033F19165